MFYEEGTFATIVFGNCVLKETGRHVIWLLDVVMDIYNPWPRNL